MYISLNWLREFVELPDSLDAEELGQLITLRSCEVEKIHQQKKAFENMLIGKVIELRKHPNADQLSLVKTDIGDRKVQIVCGGINLQEGMFVAVGLPGSKVVWHGTEEMVLKETKIRGEDSFGMICAGEEIGLPAGGDKEILDLSHLKVKPGTPLAEALNMDDVIYEIDNKSLTHRPDLWGHRGMAREIAAITGYPFRDKETKLKVTNSKGPSIEVKNSELCPRYMGLVIRNVRVTESPEWLKQGLRATDHSIISNMVDVTNFVMEELGQPLHAFDLKKISKGMVVRTAKKGETLTTLDGPTRDLTEDMLVIADHEKPLAIAGVMGGLDSGVFEETTDILLESANFDPISVRQTSVKLGLRTDSVQRFEKSLDPELCEKALLRAAELILELCPEAQIEGGMTDVANYEKSDLQIELFADRVRSKMGVPLPSTEMADYLRRLGFEIPTEVSDRTESFWVNIPSWRATKDVDIEEDLVEEIARLYGYERIPALVPTLPAKAPWFNFERSHQHEARRVFAFGLNYTEVYNYSFYSLQRLTQYGLEEPTHLRLANVLSEEQSHLRTSLIPNLVTSLKEAIKYDEAAALFELGHVYLEKGQFMPEEVKRLAAVRHFPDREGAFSLMKGDLEYFLEAYGVGTVRFMESKKALPYMHPYQSAELWIEGACAGHLFVLHPALRDEERFEGSIGVFELDMAFLHRAKGRVQRYQEESKFPSIEFDVSVLIDKKHSYDEVLNKIKKAIPELLQKVELFDVYESKEMGENQRSLAFRLTLQAKDRTLSGSDLETCQKKVWQALEALGGSIRGK